MVIWNLLRLIVISKTAVQSKRDFILRLVAQVPSVRGLRQQAIVYAVMTAEAALKSDSAFMLSSCLFMMTV